MMSPPEYLAVAVAHPNFETTDFSHLKLLICSGSTANKQAEEKLSKRMPTGDIHDVYGLSEIGVATANKPAKSGSVGLLRPGVMAKIIDDHGQRCDINECGEICFKSDGCFTGYHGDAAKSCEAFDADGWFLTGDIGYFDEDGYLFIVDRKKDILKYSGYQVVPAEIEILLMEHAAVKQVCVIGIPHAVRIDLPAAVIVTHENCQLTEQQVLDYLEGKSWV